MSQSLIWHQPPISHDWLQDSLKQDDTQVERLGSDLQVQVKKLVVALRVITKRERQQVIERMHEDCSKVRDDMSHTLSIQHYLASLLAETDPFLLIWVRLGAEQTLCCTSHVIWQNQSQLPAQQESNSLYVFISGRVYILIHFSHCRQQGTNNQIPSVFLCNIKYQ